MSTATLDTPHTAAKRELDVFVMPSVQLGQFVMFYPDGGSNEEAGVVAQVLGIDRFVLQLNVFGHKDFPQSFVSHQMLVRHRTDPHLKTNNPYITKYGCWDYTPWEKSLRSEISELKATVAKLVSDLGGPTTKGKKSE